MSLLSFAKKVAGREETKTKGGTKQKKAAAKVEQKKDVSAEATPTVGAVTGVVVLTPLLTEKSVDQQALNNTVSFRVEPHVTKGQIAQAVQKRYKVTPVSVRTLMQSPKQRRRGQTQGQTTKWKKAYVTLAEGQQIDFTV